MFKYKPEKLEQFIGYTQGNLKVIKFLETKDKTSWWLCRCICGTEKSIPRYSLVPSSKIKSCGCQKHNQPKRENSKRWTGIGEMSGDYWFNLKTGAQARNLEVTINKEDAWNLFLKQDRKCALSSIELQFPSKGKATDGTASLDRIDSTKGYIPGNVQWVHKDINRMKMQLDEKKFIELCVLIARKSQGID